MGDCHVSPSNCAYFSSWCPTCERHSPRIRSRSESNPHECRRRSTKSPSPRKFAPSAECENMDCPPRDTWSRDFRHALRSNQLCELPTTYISNNCQARMGPPEKALRARLPRDITYDTSTYFDTIQDVRGLHERYAQEVDSVRETMAQWRQKNCTRGSAVPIGDSKRLKEQYEKDLEAMRYRMRAPRECLSVRSQELVPRPKRIAVKTRSRIQVMKRRCEMAPRAPPPTAIMRHFSESECSDSDESDSEEVIQEDLKDESEETSESTSTTTQSNTCLTETGSGDEQLWPIRFSLFPHIPPYIRFSTHDAEAPVSLPAGRKLFKWKLSTITPIVVRKTLSNTGFIMVRKSNQWMGTWGKHMKSPMFKTLKEMQKLNHFPGTFQLGRKDRLWRNFQKHINKYGYKEFGFLPQTFILPQELKLLKQNWENKHGHGMEAWIIKPPASARGVGIKVINKWSQLPKKMSLVVQRYISNPYLINGSKFDLRLYVLVTSFHPLRIYLYPEGLARFASAKYSDHAKDLRDQYVHLTNYSINKLSSQYTANEDANSCQGHKWTLTKLFEYLAEQHQVDTKSLWRNLQQLVIKTIISGEAPITQLCEENLLNRYNCYELFGVDVLLDEHLKPWLLEVNISPSLHSASPLDAHVKGPLVQTLFDLAQFHLPARLAQLCPTAPPCYEPKLYSTSLTRKEHDKQNLFVQYENREDYLDTILAELTGDDVRKLTQAEDEMAVKGRFERIFPTSTSHKYLNFMEVRYYNRLFDAWETRFEKNRTEGVAMLRALCEDKVHLKVAPQSIISKNSPSTIPGALSVQPSKEGQSLPLSQAMQEVTIGLSPSCN